MNGVGEMYVYKWLSSSEQYENVLLLTFITMKVSTFDLNSELKEGKKKLSENALFFSLFF